MPTRMLRDGILSSERIASLPGWAAEVFYRRLMSVVDDYGRYHGVPTLLRAACYPRQIDRVTDADIVGWLRDAERAGLLQTYAVSGKPYVQLLDFGQRVQAKSKFPAPPVTHGVPPEKTALVVVEDVVEERQEPPTPNDDPAPEAPAPDDPPAPARQSGFKAEEVELPQCIPAESWAEWCAFRRQKRQKLTEVGVARQIKFLIEQHARGSPPAEILAQSVLNGWTGLFKLKGDGNGAGSGHRGSAVDRVRANVGAR